MHDPHDRSDDAERRQGIPHFFDGMDRNRTLFVMGFQFVVHQVLDFKGIEIAPDHEAQVVSQEFHHVVVGSDHRVFAEDRALLGRLDIALDRHQSLLAYFGEDLEEQGKRLHVERLAIARAAKQTGQCLERRLNDLARVGNQEGAGSGTENHQQLDWLQQ